MSSGAEGQPPANAAAESSKRVFNYTRTSADPKKGGPSKEDLERVSALFPPSTLPTLATHLQSLLRSTSARDESGPVSPQTDAMLNRSRRVFTFRAHYLIYWLLKDKAKGLDKIKTEVDAFALAQLLYAAKPVTLFRRCELVKEGSEGAFVKVADPSGKRDKQGKLSTLDVVVETGGGQAPPPHFETGPDSSRALGVRYYWKYEGGAHWNYIKLAIIGVLVLSFNMYQLWPSWARNIVWFLSVTALLFILGVCLLQGLLFLLVWPTGYSFWLLPNFTSDDAPIWLLFSPFYTFERSKGSNAYLRALLIALIAAAAYFVSAVPSTEWLDFIDSQGKIVQDLYSGTLLTDGKEGAGVLTAGGGVRFENPFVKTWGPGKYMGRAVPVPSLADLDKMGEEGVEKELVDDDAAAAAAAATTDAAAAAAAADAADAAAAAAEAEAGAAGAEGGHAEQAL